MNVALRALSWAIRFFWIITLAFAVTCVYSATLIRVNIGEPTMTSNGEEFQVMLPVFFDNKGYYSIADLNVTTLIADAETNQISKAMTYIAQIPPQKNATVFHNVSLSIGQIIAHADYLFNDSNLTVHGMVHLNYASVVPLGVETNKTIPWGAPLSNFTIGIPTYSPYNSTHFTADVPISFQNNSPYFSVTGTLRVEIFNDEHQPLGSGVVPVDVLSSDIYNGGTETLINAASLTERGQIHVYAETGMFNYGPLVMNFG